MRARLLPAAVIVLALIAVGAGYLVYRQAMEPPSEVVGKPPPHIAGLSDLDDKAHDFGEWKGKLLLINFWATWCGPCLKEIPELVKAQERYAARGLQLVGPAVDDPDSVKNLLPTLKLDYPVLVTSSPDAMIHGMEQLENSVGGLPFSVLVGPDGNVLATHLGPLEPNEIASWIEPHLPH